MKLVIDLLRQKNNYLIQFAKISSLECHRLQSGNYKHIEQFYYSRQVILDAIENIDIHLKRYSVQSVSEVDKKTVRELLQEKRKIARDILQTDLLIHSYLNNSQNKGIVEDQIA